ncbi:MAG: response regulator [Burkholderiales bacterium]|nr:response regulator [Burkholderiales bacterium]ODU67785.1 MAG: hypothetical protein ABT05_03315 [Lautropia sp. SCN 66-9]
MKRLEGPSIGQRMAIGFGVLALIIVTLFAAVYVWQRHSDEALHSFAQVSQPLSDAANELESALLRVGITMHSYMLQPQAPQLERYERALRMANVRLLQLDSAARDTEAHAMFARFEPQLHAYLSATRQLVSQRSLGATVEGAELEVGEMRESALAPLRDFIELQAQRTDASLAEMQQAQQRVSQSLSVAAVLSLLLFAVFAWLITQSIRRPTRTLVDVAASLQQGDWKPALALTGGSADGASARLRSNELVQIGRAFGAAAVALERRAQRLAADRNVAGATAASLEQAELAQQVLAGVLAHVGAELGVVYVFDGGDEKAPLLPVASYGLAPSAAALITAEGLPAQAVHDRKPVRVRNIPPDSAFQVRLGYDAAPPRDVLAVPVCFQRRALGVLLVASLRAFDDEALDFVGAAADQLGVGLNNALAHEEVQRLLIELAEKTRQVQAQNEELQVQNEEIQAQSEEVQAQNEELQAQGEEIRAQHEQVLEHTTRLREQSKQLGESDRRKNEFLGLLAHELRNPIAGISNSIFVLSRPGLAAEQADGARAVIHRQARQLNRLIDDLLDITRVSHGKISLKPERLDLVQLLRDTLDDHRPAFDSARVALHIDLPTAPVEVEVDRVRMCQVVGNLLDNALKFSDSDGVVRVRLSTVGGSGGGSRDGSGTAQLSIVDTGVGIDAAAFSRLFEPFSQGDPSITRRSGGLGLGLALVKVLVEMHGGTVQAFSDGAGKGARFVVSLPLAEERRFEDAVPPAEGPSLPDHTQALLDPCRILIIEDNADVAQSLASAMRLDGHEVRIAHSAAEGLEAAHEFRPDVLLCDIGLPIMDGYEVARRFRSDAALKSVYLVAVTGYAGEREREQAIHAGFDRHLPKPPDLQELNEVLAEVARRRVRDAGR